MDFTLHDEQGTTAARLSLSDTDPHPEGETVLRPRSHAITIAFSTLYSLRQNRPI